MASAAVSFSTPNPILSPPQPRHYGTPWAKTFLIPNSTSNPLFDTTTTITDQITEE
jgi:hypothetical protein